MAIITLYKDQWEESLSPHFKVKEFFTNERPAPASHPLDDRLIQIGEYLRTHFGQPMGGMLTNGKSRFSTYRSYAYNANQPGSSETSHHLSGHACDYNWIQNEEAVLIALFYDISTRGPIFDELVRLGGREFIMYGGAGGNFIHIATAGPIKVIDNRSPSWRNKVPVITESGNYSTNEVQSSGSIITQASETAQDAFFEFLMNAKLALGQGGEDDILATNRFLSNPKYELYGKILLVVLLLFSPLIIKKYVRI